MKFEVITIEGFRALRSKAGVGTKRRLRMSDWLLAHLTRPITSGSFSIPGAGWMEVENDGGPEESVWAVRIEVELIVERPY